METEVDYFGLTCCLFCRNILLKYLGFLDTNTPSAAQCLAPQEVRRKLRPGNRAGAEWAVCAAQKKQFTRAAVVPCISAVGTMS